MLLAVEAHRREACRVAIATLLVASCASQAAEHDGSKRDASAREINPPPDSRVVTLTFWPFHEIPMDANGYGAPIPLGGVEVCVAKKRAYGASWEAFVDTTMPCVTTGESPDAASEKVVLPGAPGMSELVVTAKKDGYQPRVIAVTTGAWDEDITAQTGTADNFFFNLIRQGAAGALFPSTVPVASNLGTLVVFSVVVEAANGLFVGGTLGDVTVSVDPSQGEGPFYFLGGKWIPGSTRTVPGLVTTPSALSGATMVNLPEGEYDVTVAQPAAFCGNPFGRSGNAAYGYAASSGTLRAPVRAGYATEVSAECGCLGSHDILRCGIPVDSGLLGSH